MRFTRLNARRGRENQQEESGSGTILRLKVCLASLGIGWLVFFDSKMIMLPSFITTMETTSMTKYGCRPSSTLSDEESSSPPAIVSNNTAAKEALLSETRNRLQRLKKRDYVAIIEVQRNGAISVINRPNKSPTGPHEGKILEYLKLRIQAALEEYGDFRIDDHESFFFDVDMIDFPAVHEGTPLSCESITQQACCFNQLPLIGIGSNPCCKCSLPLPVHGNQIPDYLEAYLQYKDPYNWTEKIDKAVWHGEPNGWGYVAAWLSREYNATVPYHSAGRETPRSRLVRYANAAATDAAKKEDLLDASFRKREWRDVLKYKYIVTIAGFAYAGLLKPALLSNSCVLKQEAMSREWYEDKLQEWVHYVPVEFDLSDLFEKIRWAKEHDKECEQIAKEGRKFALEHFHKGAVNKFVHNAIQKGRLNTIASAYNVERLDAVDKEMQVLAEERTALKQKITTMKQILGTDAELENAE